MKAQYTLENNSIPILDVVGEASLDK